MAKAPNKKEKEKKKEKEQEDEKKQRDEREQEHKTEQENEDNPLYGLSFGDAIKKITKDDDKEKPKK